MSDIIEVIKDVTTVTIASDGPQGPQGPTGPTGATGPAGPPGADGVSGVISVVAPITNTGTSTAAIIGINAGVANGVATLDSGGKIPQSQIPAVAITNTFVVASQAAMLALTAEEGDVAVRTDENKTYILTATPATTLANWQELLTPTDSVLSVDGLTGAVDLTGKYSQLTASNTFLAQNIFNASSTSVVDLIVRATASQTANLQEWQNSAGSVRTWISSNGTFNTAAGTGISTNFVTSTTSGSGAYLETSSTHMTAQTRAAANIGLIVKGAASQTANLQEWQNSAGTVMTGISSGGGIFTSSNNSFNSASGFGGLGAFTNSSIVGISTNTASYIGLLVRGVASQTGDLQQWQNSSGTVLFSILSNGRVSTNQRTNFGFPIASAVFDAQNNFSNDTDAARVIMLVRGAASQTGNLQEWQNSAASIVARVASSGSFLANSLQTLDGRAVISQEDTGAVMRMLKLSVAGSNPGSGQGKLYFRDGTNAGTLKLVVRAGAAGAETTILDNIPQ
jgi:hypothetical protein